jgi:hypothetical protein
MPEYVYSEKMKYPAYLMRFSAPAQTFDGGNWAATERDLFCAGTYMVRCNLEDQEIMASLAGRCEGVLKVYRMDEGESCFTQIGRSEIAEILKSGSKWKESTLMHEAIEKLEMK